MSQRAAIASSSPSSAQRSGRGLALVVGHAALERHAARVVADRADLGDLVVAQHDLGGQRGELGALVLDRPGAVPASWISVGTTHATAVREVPLRTRAAAA